VREVRQAAIEVELPHVEQRVRLATRISRVAIRCARFPEQAFRLVELAVLGGQAAPGVELTPPWAWFLGRRQESELPCLIDLGTS